jgi:hypothetical protein
VQKLPQFAVRRLREAVPDEMRHPDADVLAAFAEQSLASRERAEVMEHLARCGGCREILSVSLPAIETHATARISPGRSAWLAWPVLRWGALAAGVLIVCAAGVLQYAHRPQGTIVASNFPNVAPEAMKDSSSAAAATAVQAPAQMNIPEQVLPSKIPVVSQKQALFNTLQTVDGANGFQIGRHGPRNAGNEPQAQDGSGISENSVLGQSSGTSLNSGANAFPQWAVTPVGGLQRSFDEGKSWENVHPEGDLTFTTSFLFRAVTANGLDVWVGGSEGALFHSVDGGNRWLRQMPSTSGTALEGDIVSIQFADPENGKIVTSIGQLWTTSDAGQSWQRQ